MLFLWHTNLQLVKQVSDVAEKKTPFKHTLLL